MFNKITPEVIYMHISYLTVLITAMLLCCSCNKAEEQQSTAQEESSLLPTSSKRLQSLVSSELFNILENSTKAVFYPVKPDPSGSKGDYKALNNPVEFPNSLLKGIQAILIDDATYMFDAKKKCLFLPNLAIEMKLDEEKLTILIGTSCKQVRFIHDDEKITLDVDPAFTEIEKLVNSLRRKNQS